MGTGDGFLAGTCLFVRSAAYHHHSHRRTWPGTAILLGSVGSTRVTAARAEWNQEPRGGGWLGCARLSSCATAASSAVAVTTPPRQRRACGPDGAAPVCRCTLQDCCERPPTLAGGRCMAAGARWAQWCMALKQDTQAMWRLNAVGSGADEEGQMCGPCPAHVAPAVAAATSGRVAARSLALPALAQLLLALHKLQRVLFNQMEKLWLNRQTT